MHTDKIYYCACSCGCTDVVASDVHEECTFCRKLHLKADGKYQINKPRKEIKL